MKGHVFIADTTSLEVVHNKGIFGVFQETRDKVQWKKTRADILADLSCIRAGDRLFFYDIDRTAFWGIYEATTRLFLDEKTDLGFQELAPYRVGVKPFFRLENPLPENDLFTRQNAARDFRSIFFKKVLGRGKACTHLFTDETELLSKLLLMQNDVAPKAKGGEKAIRANDMRPEFERRGRECSLEKELEWWLTYHLDSHPECRKVFGEPANIEMFANYVPLTISGGNIDLVVYHQTQANEHSIRNKISVVEIKKGKATPDAMRELVNYVRWFIRNITGADDTSIIQPILIASDFVGEVVQECKYWNLCERKPKLFRYQATSNSEIIFEEIPNE